MGLARLSAGETQAAGGREVGGARTAGETRAATPTPTCPRPALPHLNPATALCPASGPGAGGMCEVSRPHGAVPGPGLPGRRAELLGGSSLGGGHWPVASSCLKGCGHRREGRGGESERRRRQGGAVREGGGGTWAMVGRLQGRGGWDPGPGLRGGAGTGNWLPSGPAGESKRRHARPGCQGVRSQQHQGPGHEAAPPGEALEPGQRAGQWDQGGGR